VSKSISAQGGCGGDDSGVDSGSSSDSLPTEVKQAAEFANQPDPGSAADAQQLFDAGEFSALDATGANARMIFWRLVLFAPDVKRAQLRLLRESNGPLYDKYQCHTSLQSAGWSYNESWSCYVKGELKDVSGKWSSVWNYTIENWLWLFEPTPLVDLEGPQHADDQAAERDEPPTHCTVQPIPVKAAGGPRKESAAATLPRSFSRVESLLKPQVPAKPGRVRNPQAEADNMHTTMNASLSGGISEPPPLAAARAKSVSSGPAPMPIAADKSAQRGTSLQNLVKFQPKSRVTGQRKQEAQYADEVRKRQNAEAQHRGGRKTRHGSAVQADEAGEDGSTSGEADSGETAAPADAEQVLPVRPAYSDVPYTPALEPGRSKRGRRVDISSQRDEPFSCRAHISYASSLLLGAFIIDAGLVDDRRGQPCPVCPSVQRKTRNSAGGTLCLGEVIRHPKPWMSISVPVYVCSVNSKHMQHLTEGHEDVFPGPMSPVTLRRYLEFLWLLTDGLTVPSCIQLARDLGVKPESLRPYYNRVLEYVAVHQGHENAKMRLGGAGDPEAKKDTDRLPIQVEMDELCFRSKAVILRDALVAFPEIRDQLPEGVDETAAKVDGTSCLFGYCHSCLCMCSLNAYLFVCVCVCLCLSLCV
jgi:hypothetical protein